MNIICLYSDYRLIVRSMNLSLINNWSNIQILIEPYFELIFFSQNYNLSN